MNRVTLMQPRTAAWRAHPHRCRASGRCRRQLGFTLLEVLLALTLLALVMTLLFSSMRFGGRAWDRVAENAQSGESAHLAQAFLRRTLASVRVVSEADTGEGDELDEPPAVVAGDSRRLSFVAPPPAHWSDAPLYHYEVLRQRRDGRAVLLLRYRPIIPWEKNMDRGETQEVVLIEDIKTVRFGYYGSAEEDAPEARWQSSWDADFLPRLVRMELESDSERPSWPPLVFTLPDTAAAEPVRPRTIEFGPY